jgi:hypothetical protein
MSSYNPFCALTLLTFFGPELTVIPPPREPSSLLGSKHPCTSSSPPPRAPRPPLTTRTPALEAIDQYSVFDIQNIFHARWFIAREHLITNVLSATKDDHGCFIWVNFMPQFHTSLIKHMVTLLPAGYPMFHGKKILFVFLLEVLTSDKGVKPEVFWHASKKCSQAS